MVKPASSNKNLSVALLAVPETTASTMLGFYDLLSSVGRDWEFLVEGKTSQSKITPYIVSASGQTMKVTNNIVIQPDYSIDRCPTPDIICIADIFVAPEESITDRYLAEINWLLTAFNNGATIATSCSGALLLAEAGLLDDCDATIHWAYADTFSQRYPKINVCKQRALVASGDGQRLVMAGGGTSWFDLVLYLIARYFSVETALQIAKIYLIDWHQTGQLPYACLTQSQQKADIVIANCQIWLAEHYNQASPVAQMTKLCGLAERSFKRRFHKATGLTPLEYVHTLRIEESKQMLETETTSIEIIAFEVGYEDKSFFSKLFKRKVGLTPAQYRNRFSSLSKLLSEATQA